jgi:hypothetical protein
MCLFLVGLMSSASSAEVIYLSRESAYDFAFLDKAAFSDALVQYSVTHELRADAVGDTLYADPGWNLKTLSQDIDAWADSNIDYAWWVTQTLNESLLFSDPDDLDGFRTWTYSTPFTDTPQPNDESWITRSTGPTGATLEFLGGGQQSEQHGTAGIPFTVSVALPGDWSSFGTHPGQLEFIGIDTAWIIEEMFVYSPDSNSTHFRAVNPSYEPYALANLNFVLHGVPEPGTGLLLLTAAVVALRRERNRAAPA